MKLPCLKEDGLRLFSTTADQRYKIGRDVFLKTHFSLKFHRYKKQSLYEVWNEEKLLSQLENNISKNIGNRVFILFGAAGSGKSETIKWLESKLKFEKEKNRPIFRISRTELDPVLILKKLLSIAGEELNEDIIINWGILKNKPVTLANNLIWNALDSLLNSDENIIPISYKLRPLIEANLRNNFSKMGNKDEFKDKKMELFSLEELERVVSESEISIDINYEQLRDKLVKQFEKEVLGGYNFAKVLKQTGEILKKQSGQRPILLIDDLVQSMNIYSSDLLNFFITLEEGNWDIVIGLTPSSFEGSKRGRQLLTRIDNLDTFDDRLIKLWLTDQSGEKSYFLNDNTVVEYIKNYLLEYKKVNGFKCSKKCSSFDECKSLHWGKISDVNLTPLNRPLIKRFFSNLFKGKGQARQFVEIVGKYIESLLENDFISFLERYVKRDRYIDIDDNKKRIFIESLMPNNITNKLKVSKGFLQLGGFKQSEDIILNVVELKNKGLKKQIQNIEFDEEDQSDLIAVRDWLENDKINKELLRPFRKLCSKFIREFSDATIIKYPNTSQNWSTIKYKKRIEGIYLPLVIEDIDSFEGIKVNRLIGYQALKLMKLDDIDEDQGLINDLVKNFEIEKLINNSSELNCYWKDEFEQTLEINCSELAFLLYVFSFHISIFKLYPKIIFDNYFMGSLNKLPEKWNNFVGELSSEEEKFIKDFFIDWFQIRKNLYDAFRLKKFIDNYPNFYSVIKRLTKVKLSKLSKNYKMKNRQVKKILVKIIDLAIQYKKLINNQELIKFCQSSLETMNYLVEIDVSNIKSLNSTLKSIYENYPDEGKLFKLPIMPDVTEITFKTVNNKMVYPEYISKLTQDVKNPVYIWFEDIHDFLQKIVQENERLYAKAENKIPNYIASRSSYLKEIKINLDRISIEKLNVFESVKLVKKTNKMINKFFMELDYINQFKSMIKYINQKCIKDYLEFYKYFSLFSSKTEYQNLEREKYYKLLKSYLNNLDTILDFKKDDNDYIIYRVYFLLKNNYLRESKLNICNEIIVRIKFYQRLANKKWMNKERDKKTKTLLEDLQGIINGNQYKNYELIAKQVEDLTNSYRTKLRNSKLFEDNIASKDARDLIISLLDFGVKSQKINFFNLVGINEIKELIPEIANKIEVSFELKI